jgi:hypothetical protein
MRLLLLIPLAVSVACLRENPAFDGVIALTVATDGSGTTGTTGPDTNDTTGPGTASTAADTSTGLPDPGGTGSTGMVSAGTTGSSTGDTTGVDSDSSGETGTTGGTSTGADTTTGESTDGPIDLPAEATLCGKPGPWVFSEPQALGMPVNVEQGDLDMWLSYTGLILLWSSHRDGAQDTYRASRLEVGMPFEFSYANNKDIGLSTPGQDGKLALSNADARAYLSTKLPGDTNFRIHMGDRKGQNYGPLTPVTLEFPGYTEAHDPHISSDDLRLYYAPAGADDQRLVVATRPGPDQPFGTPSAEPFVNVDDPERPENDPTLPAHELVLIYTRPGPIESGGHDLWFAARASIGEPFGPPQPVPGVNGPGHELSAHLRGDGCELFFARSTVQDEGAWDIYRSEIQ